MVPFSRSNKNVHDMKEYTSISLYKFLLLKLIIHLLLYVFSASQLLISNIMRWSMLKLKNPTEKLHCKLSFEYFPTLMLHHMCTDKMHVTVNATAVLLSSDIFIIHVHQMATNTATLKNVRTGFSPVFSVTRGCSLNFTCSLVQEGYLFIYLFNVYMSRGTNLSF